MNNLKVKVCGMRDPENIDAVCASMPDFLGFIFYPKSKRYVGEEPDRSIFDRVPASIKKAGVFVNEDAEKVVEQCQSFGLEVAQLHGNESPEYCLQIKESGLIVFKAFSVDDDFGFSRLNAYNNAVDYFLFDTKGKLPGGTGEKFNWNILNGYKGSKPFFLSGGIGPEDYSSILAISHPQLFAVDINSGFEIEPALKDAGKVNEFIDKIRSNSTQYKV